MQVKIPIFIRKHKINAMVDNGADRSFISQTTARKLSLDIDPSKSLLVTGFDGRNMASIGTATAEVELRSNHETQNIKHQFIVIPKSPAEVVLGRNFLKNRAIINHVKGVASFFSSSSDKPAAIGNNYYSDKSELTQCDQVEAAKNQVESDSEKITNSKNDQPDLDALFIEFASIFDAGEHQKCIPSLEMKINTTSEIPIKEKTRKVKVDEFKEMKSQVEILIKRKVARTRTRIAEVNKKPDSVV